MKELELGKDILVFTIVNKFGTCTGQNYSI